MRWVGKSAAVDVEAGAEEVFDTYADLAAMPRWSPWLVRVEVDARDAERSTWVLGARGITVRWRARNTDVRRGRVIAWESVDGLKNRGRVTFDENKPGVTSVRLAVEVDLPDRLASAALRNESAMRFIEDTLLADLRRFRRVVLADRSKRRRAERKAEA